MTLKKHIGRRLKMIAVCVGPEVRACLRAAAALGLDYDMVADIDQYPADPDLPSLQTDTFATADAVLLDIDRDRAAALHLAALLTRAYGDSVAIIAISNSSSPDAIIAAMRSGCCEYLIRPLEEKALVARFEQLQKKRLLDHSAPAGGRIVVLAGVKGGCGVSTLSTHLATFLAQRSHLRVLLADLHPDLGSVGTLLGLGNEGYSFYDVVANLHRLDADLVGGLVTRHESGAHVLVSRMREEPPPPNLSSDVENTLSFLQTIYDVILLDTPPGLSFLNVLTVGRADTVALVMTPEVAAVRNLVCCLDHLSTLSCPRSRIELVVNRHSRRNGVSDEQVANAAHLNVAHRIPNAYSSVIAANNLGSPLAPDNRSEFAQSILHWADAISARVTCPPSAAREIRPTRSLASILGL